MDECVESDIVFKWTYCCRLCLTANACIDIFQSEDMDILHKLETNLTLLIYPGDPMPQRLCNVCFEQLNSWHQFKQKCNESDATLKKRLLPFKSLDFVRVYLEKDPKISVKEENTGLQFPTLAVKDEPLESLKDIGISSGSASEVADTGQMLNQGDRDWSDNDTADTVFDDEVVDNPSGLDILRQMVGVNENASCSSDPTAPKKVDQISVISPGKLNSFAGFVSNSPLEADPSENHEIYQQNRNDRITPIDTLPESRSPDHLNNSQSTSPCMKDRSQQNNMVTEQTTNLIVENHPSDTLLGENVLPLTGDTRYSNTQAGAGENVENETSNNNDFMDTATENPHSISTEPETIAKAATSIVEFLDIQIKEEPGLIPEIVDGKKYNLRRRREAIYDEDDLSEDSKNTPPVRILRQRATPWKCDACKIYFSSNQNLLNHYSNDDCVGAKMECFPCLVCEKKFFSETAMAEHNVRHARVAYNLSVDDLHHCRKCDAAYADQHRLTQHDKCHSQKGIPSQATQYSCSDCGLVFIKRIKFEEHKRSHEMAHIPHVYEQSQVNIPEAVPDRDIACSLCIARFKSEDLLYDHRFAVHGIPDERVACPTCGTKFRDAALLSDHMKSHSQNTARKSTNPYFQILDTRTLGKEQQSLAGGSVRCRRCGVVFHSREELARHELLKHKNLTPYWCRKCNRKFPTRSLLLMHHREHAGSLVVPFKPSPMAEPVPDSYKFSFIVGKSCHNCSVQFMSDTDIRRHTSAHRMFGNPQLKFKHSIGVLFKYQCTGCPQLFTQNKTMEKHFFKRHNGTRFELVPLEVPVSRSVVPLPRYQCKICDGNFNCQASLNFHSKVKHGHASHAAVEPSKEESLEEDEQECPFCFKLFPVSLMEKHMSNMHRAGSSKKCRVCSKVCSNSYNLAKHEMAHRAGSVSLLKCRFCSKEFPPKYKGNHQKHEERCGKVMGNAATPPTPPRSAPPSDSASSSEFTLKCAICGNIYETESLLELHTMTAHGLMSFKHTPVKQKELWQEEDNRIVREMGGVFRCTLCQLQFDSAESVTWHKALHPRGNLYILQVDDSLFQCTACDHMFDHRNDAMRHAIDHAAIDIKPVLSDVSKNFFNCPFCSSKFATEDRIRSHIIYDHPGGSSNAL